MAQVLKKEGFLISSNPKYPEEVIMFIDPYGRFIQWCLKNGFSDVIYCEAKDVNLQRLGQAVNQYIPKGRKNTLTEERGIGRNT